MLGFRSGWRTWLHKGDMRELSGWWNCSVPWLWWWLQKYTYLPNLIKLFRKSNNNKCTSWKLKSTFYKNCRWTNYLHFKISTKHLEEESRGEYLNDIMVLMIQKSWTTKEKIINYIKNFKLLCNSQVTHWEKVFAASINQRFISKIYKNIYKSIRKSQRTQ